MIAVGTPFTGRPRTDLYVRHSRIRLPPRVFDGEALLRPGMKDARLGEPVGGQLLQPIPRDAAPLAASSQRAAPESDHMVPEASQRPIVGRDRVVGEVATHDPLQPCPLLGDRLMPTPSQPLLDLLEPCLHAVTPGLPPDEEAART
jgi:hypothetical protein